MGQYQTFILYISAGNYYYEVIFGKDPFLRTLYLKMAPNPIISQIYFLWRHTSVLYYFAIELKKPKKLSHTKFKLMIA